MTSEVEVSKCVVFVKNPVESKRKWGEEKLPIAHQYAYLGGDISRKLWLGCTCESTNRKGKAQRGEMCVRLAPSY